MNRVWAPNLWAFLALLFLAVPTPGAVGDTSLSLPKTELYGRSQVSLQSWAATKRLGVKWNKASGAVYLTNAATRLMFTVDSRRAEFNGTRFWLTSPITPHRDGLVVSSTDVDLTLAPLLRPPKLKRGAAIRTIVLDPGHGGKDPGFLTGREQEKKHTLLLSKKVETRLRAAGFRVVTTRSVDEFVELTDRTRISRKAKGDLFISLHYNASDTSRGAVKGAETYCLTPKGAASTNARGDEGPQNVYAGHWYAQQNMMLAYQIQRAITKGVDIDDRGVKRARYQVLQNPGCPAVLIEGGFLSDPGELKAINSDTRRDQMARAIVDGVQAYKRLVER